jgi:hypothetical protein
MQIKSKRLVVDLDMPGEKYKGMRFDNTGLITQVILDGKHEFCSAEKMIEQEGLGGIGLCNEFGLCYVPEYEDMAVGDEFVKIGVGLVKKTSEAPYLSWEPYPLNRFNIEIESGQDWARYKVKSEERNGYNVDYEKDIKVIDNCIYVEYRLCNTGKKGLNINEYCHNFIAIDKNKVGSEYSLKAPCSLEVTSENVSETEGNRLTWKNVPDKTFYMAVDADNTEMGREWCIEHMPTGVSMAEKVDCDLVRFALWGEAHVVSPEMFIKVDLKPGESKIWHRIFTFNSK